MRISSTVVGGSYTNDNGDKGSISGDRDGNTLKLKFSSDVSPGDCAMLAQLSTDRSTLTGLYNCKSGDPRFVEGARLTLQRIVEAKGAGASTTRPAIAVNPILCRDPVDRRPVSPPTFDPGYRDACRAYLYINDDDICDYCRTVGDRNQLRCTLGTATGLDGLESDAIGLQGGAPYPETCEWIDYRGERIPALQGEIGNNHETVSITTVKMSPDGKQIVIGPTQSRPNVK